MAGLRLLDLWVVLLSLASAVLFWFYRSLFVVKIIKVRVFCDEFFAHVCFVGDLD